MEFKNRHRPIQCIIEIHDNKIWSNESPNIYFNISVKRISKPVNVQYICLQCYNGNY